MIERSAHLTNEGKRFGFGILYGPDTPLSPAPLYVDPFHVSKVGRIEDLKDAADGLNSCYSITNDGMLRIVAIPAQYRRNLPDETLRELSKVTYSLCFYVGINNSKVFSKGVLVRTWRKGAWLEPPDELSLSKMANEGYGKEVLTEIIQLCVTMSETGRGGTIILQKEDALNSCKAMKEVMFTEIPLDQIPMNQLVTYAALDGAVVISAKGRVLAVSQRLIYPEWGGANGSGGARHESASKYSSHHECLAFTISSDGPISIYKDGSLFAKYFGELKP